jgi:hypothetical protein
VLIAMVEYLRSGDSKVGYLNNSVEKNMLHKDNEVQFEKSVARDRGSGQIQERDMRDVAGDGLGDGNSAVVLRRSMRKRKAESTEDRSVTVKSRKRKTWAGMQEMGDKPYGVSILGIVVGKFGILSFWYACISGRLTCSTVFIPLYFLFHIRRLSSTFYRLYQQHDPHLTNQISHLHYSHLGEKHSDMLEPREILHRHT